MAVPVRAAVGFIILALILSVVAPAAAAACGTTAAQQLAETTKGPYDITFGVLPDNPSLGYVRLVVTVCDAATGRPVRDAQVSFIPTNPEGEVGAPIYGLNRFGSAEEYSAELSVEASGLWHYRVQIEGEAGQVTLEVPVEIRQPANYGGFATVVFLLTTGALLAGGLYLFNASRR